MGHKLMKLNATLCLAVALLLMIAFVACGPITASSTKIWPLEDEKFASPMYQKCEVCQLFTRVVNNEVATFKRNAKLTKEQLLEHEISDIIVFSTICSPKNFKRFEGVIDIELHVVAAVCQDMALALKTLDEDAEIDVEDLFQSEKIANILCSPKFCDDLWTKEEQPDKRETKVQRHIRYAAEFSEWNKNQPNVITLPSGLQYKILSKGGRKGAKSPQPDDTVKVEYRGRHLNGTEFDSSYKRNKPAEFVVKSVIAGWREGVQLMSEGDMFRLFVPADMAYGEKGAGGGIIEPNELLVFDIEMKKVTEYTAEL